MNYWPMQMSDEPSRGDVGGRNAEGSVSDSSEGTEKTKAHHFRHLPLKLRQLQPGWVRRRKPNKKKA